MTGTQELQLDATTVLAANLNAAMRSPQAQAAYLAVWGVAWSPIGCGATISDAKSTTENTVK